MMSQNVFFPNLDGLRFLAFFYVFMYHCYFQVPVQGEDNQIYLVFHKLWENGDLGVNFFFTLSGFLITYLLLVEEKKNGSFSIKAFYWRRTLRIWPLYFTTLIFGSFIFQLLLISVNAEIEESANVWYYIFFLGNFNSIFNGAPVSGTLSVLWSLAVEEQFYLFWPIFLLLFKKYRLQLFIILILFSLVFRVMHYHDHDIVFYHTFSVMSDLVIGSWLAWCCFHKEFKPGGSLLISPKYNTLIYLLGFTFVLFRKDLFLEPIFVVLERLIFSIFFAFIIYDQTFSSTARFQTVQFEKISFWGKFTYGLYCLHIPAMIFTEGFAMIGGVYESAWWVFFGKTISTLLLSLIFCRLSFRYLESPFLKFKNISNPFGWKQNSKINSIP
jgi:peptidoglycan/LPS O-acetylase OafA/YrhL